MASAQPIISPWCAHTSSTLGEGWLDNVATQWVILHEIAHGYQGKFMQSTTLPVNEVWNNIYAAFYQQLTLSQDNHLYVDGWLYNYGQQAVQELQLMTYIRDRFRSPAGACVRACNS